MDLLLVGLVLAFFGQLILLGTVAGSTDMASHQLFASVLLMGGALAFGAGVGYEAPPHEPRTSTGPRGRINWDRWSFAGIGAASLIGVAAVLLFVRSGETVLVVPLWLASLLLLIGSQMRWGGLHWPRIASWRYLAGLGALLAAAAIPRIVHLSNLPYNFDGDFASFGIQARAFITGAEPQVFRYGWAAIPIPGFFLASLTMKVFGDSVVGLNASGVLGGLTSILGVYLLAAELFRPRIGLLAAAALAVSYAHLAASRESQYIDPVPFLILAVYFLVIGFRHHRAWAFVASGFATSYCLELYYSGRIVVPIILAYVVLTVLLDRADFRDRIPGLILWLIAVLLGLGPMIVLFLRDPADLMVRSRDVFILHAPVLRHTMGVYRVDSLPAMLLEQARRSVLLFHYYGDTGTQFAFRRPLLDAVSGPLFVLGVGVTAFRWRQVGSALLLAWIALGVLLGAFLTVNPPFWPRLLILLPAAAIVIAVALDPLYAVGVAALQKRSRSATTMVSAILVVVFFWIAAQNWNTYVSQEGTYANITTRIARYVAEQPPAERGYVVSTGGWTYRLREFEFLIPGRLVGDLTPYQVETGVVRAGSPTVLILTPDQKEFVPELSNLYPGGKLTLVSDNAPGSVAFYAYTIP